MRVERKTWETILKNNQYPGHLEEFWSHEYQAGKHVFAERTSERKQKADALTEQGWIFFHPSDKHMLHVLWSVAVSRALISYECYFIICMTCGEKILYKWLGLLQHTLHSCIQFVNNWTRFSCQGLPPRWIQYRTCKIKS